MVLMSLVKKPIFDASFPMMAMERRRRLAVPLDTSAWRVDMADGEGRRDANLLGRAALDVSGEHAARHPGGLLKRAMRGQ